MTQMPIRSQVADTPPVLQGVAVTIETATGKALSITRFSKEYAI
jgi:calcineurin-like phosphoesterase